MTPNPTEARCHAGSDGECNWDECPQNREGEPMRSGRSCPLADWSDEEVGYPQLSNPTGPITKFGAAGSPDRTASEPTPNPTEAQTSLAEAFSHLNDDVEGRAVAWLDAEVQRLQAEVQAGKELYWALQGGLEHCPWCESGSLQHVTECPVSKYLMVVSPAYREALDG